MRWEEHEQVVVVELGGRVVHRLKREEALGHIEDLTEALATAGPVDRIDLGAGRTATHASPEEIAGAGVWWRVHRCPRCWMYSETEAECSGAPDWFMEHKKTAMVEVTVVALPDVLALLRDYAESEDRDEYHFAADYIADCYGGERD